MMDRIHPRLPSIRTEGVHPSHARGAAFAITLVAAVQLCVLYGPVGLLTYLLCVPPLLVLMITAIARLNDISLDKVGPYWNTRRCGLILVALFAASMLLVPFGSTPEWPSWWRVTGIWGFALTWLTSPSQPPWPQYIARNYRHATATIHPCRRRDDTPES